MFDLSTMLKRIKAEKKKQGYTNNTLAELTGIPVGTLNKILSGDSKDPSISAIIKIAQALNVSADYIVFGEPLPPPGEDTGITMYKQLDDEDKAEIRGEMKQMLKAPKYNNTSIGADIAADLNAHTPITIK